MSLESCYSPSINGEHNLCRGAEGFINGRIRESAGITAKVLEVLKDLPLWLLIGLALSCGFLLFVPAIAASVPAIGDRWIVIAGVVIGALAIARGVGVLFLAQ